MVAHSGWTNRARRPVPQWATQRLPALGTRSPIVPVRMAADPVTGRSQVSHFSAELGIGSASPSSGKTVSTGKTLPLADDGACMDGVVLAAGEGTRMRPLTDDQPKGLVTVAGSPLVTYAFDALLSAGADRLVVVVGYRGRVIRERFGETYEGVPVEYVEQDDRRGLAHALEQALPAVEAPFLVMNGDNVCRANLSAVVERHRDSDAAATLLVESVSPEAARETGVVVTDDDGAVTRLVEKPDDPPSTLVTRGFFAFDAPIAPACRLVTPSPRGEYELPEAIDLLLSAGYRVQTVDLDGWCANVNDPSDRERVADRLP